MADSWVLRVCCSAQKVVRCSCPILQLVVPRRGSPPSCYLCTCALSTPSTQTISLLTLLLPPSLVIQSLPTAPIDVSSYACTVSVWTVVHQYSSEIQWMVPRSHYLRSAYLPSAPQCLHTSRAALHANIEEIYAKRRCVVCKPVVIEGHPRAGTGVPQGVSHTSRFGIIAGSGRAKRFHRHCKHWHYNHFNKYR